MSEKALILLVLCALSALSAYQFGVKNTRAHFLAKISAIEAQQAKAQNALMQRYRQAEQQAQGQSDELAKALTQLEKQNHDFKQRLNDEIHRYQSAQPHRVNDTDCTGLDAQWLRLHDSAATGTMSEATSAASAAAHATRTTQDAIAVIADNYQQCREDAQRLRAWQQFYQTLQNGLNRHEENPQP